MMDGLVFLDMDNLKKINDIYGHKAGDRALKCLGKLLQKRGRSGNFLQTWRR